MSPLLTAWKADADEFGIPETTQRGLAFMLALDLSVNLSSEDQAESFEVMCRFSPLLPLRSESMGVNFNTIKIASLLSEFAFRLDPKFQPYPLHKSPDGTCTYAFPRPVVHHLPPFNIDAMCLAVFDTILSSLYRQIGEHIHEDLEGAYLAGHRFISTYAELDKTATVHVARLAVSFTPPHLKWFQQALLFSPEQIATCCPLEKISSCFMGLENQEVFQKAPQVFQAAKNLSDSFHYSAAGDRIAVIWAADVPAFTRVIVTAHVILHELHSEPEWLLEHRHALAREGFQPPPLCQSASDAFTVVRDQVRARWGYDVDASSESLYPAEQWSRRCCVMFMCTANAFMRPDWNGALARRKDER